MAIAYIEKFDGYIADTPNLDFERCDGTVFPFYEVNSSNFSDTLNFLTVTGGQGSSPLAYIPSDRTTEFSFESSQFSIDMFSMANAVNLESKDYETRETARFDVGTDGKITIPYECKAKSVRIRGLEEATEAATGKFKVEVVAAAKDTAGSTTITLSTGDFTANQPVRVSYIRRVVSASVASVQTTSSSAKGQLTAHYPVYSSGVDCTDASIKGWIHMYFPRVRVTQMPGFDASYKTASTNGVTFSVIDALRADKMYYSISYEPADASGNVVNKSEGTSPWETTTSGT